MDTRAPSAPPRRAQAFIPAACLLRRPSGRDPHPPFRLQNGVEGTRCPRPQKLFVPFQVEDPRPGDPPARLARPRRPGKTAAQRGPGRTDWVLPEPPTPAPQTARHSHAGRYLPRIERFGRHSLVTAAPCGHP